MTPPHVDGVIASVAGHYRVPPHEVEQWTIDEVIDANEAIWMQVENETRAHEASRREAEARGNIR